MVLSLPCREDCESDGVKWEHYTPQQRPYKLLRELTWECDDEVDRPMGPKDTVLGTVDAVWEQACAARIRLSAQLFVREQSSNDPYPAAHATVAAAGSHTHKVLLENTPLLRDPGGPQRLHVGDRTLCSLRALPMDPDSPLQLHAVGTTLADVMIQVLQPQEVTPDQGKELLALSRNVVSHVTGGAPKAYLRHLGCVVERGAVSPKTNPSVCEARMRRAYGVNEVVPGSSAMAAGFAPKMSIIAASATTGTVSVMLHPLETCVPGVITTWHPNAKYTQAMSAGVPPPFRQGSVKLARPILWNGVVLEEADICRNAVRAIYATPPFEQEPRIHLARLNTAAPGQEGDPSRLGLSAGGPKNPRRVFAYSEFSSSGVAFLKGAQQTQQPFVFDQDFSVGDEVVCQLCVVDSYLYAFRICTIGNEEPSHYRFTQKVHLSSSGGSNDAEFPGFVSEGFPAQVSRVASGSAAEAAGLCEGMQILEKKQRLYQGVPEMLLTLIVQELSTRCQGALIKWDPRKELGVVLLRRALCVRGVEVSTAQFQGLHHLSLPHGQETCSGLTENMHLDFRIAESPQSRPHAPEIVCRDVRVLPYM
eukprot:TRINITY_DN27806_c0_g1_i1.p1 TRINITY_DN27806_c0_g1~~TRINITY_DN27806_c0_g1_i1.p1  ORF type:complete len:624 (+),score=151.19 TRINITY_DN27806_c0_g1_i1:104-1873(+)